MKTKPQRYLWVLWLVLWAAITCAAEITEPHLYDDLEEHTLDGRLRTALLQSTVDEREINTSAFLDLAAMEGVNHDVFSLTADDTLVSTDLELVMPDGSKVQVKLDSNFETVEIDVTTHSGVMMASIDLVDGAIVDGFTEGDAELVMYELDVALSRIDIGLGARFCDPTSLLLLAVQCTEDVAGSQDRELPSQGLAACSNSVRHWVDVCGNSQVGSSRWLRGSGMICANQPYLSPRASDAYEDSRLTIDGTEDNEMFRARARPHLIDQGDTAPSNAPEMATAVALPLPRAEKDHKTLDESRAEPLENGGRGTRDREDSWGSVRLGDQHNASLPGLNNNVYLCQDPNPASPKPKPKPKDCGKQIGKPWTYFWVDASSRRMVKARFTRFERCFKVEYLTHRMGKGGKPELAILDTVWIPQDATKRKGKVTFSAYNTAIKDLKENEYEEYNPKTKKKLVKHQISTGENKIFTVDDCKKADIAQYVKTVYTITQPGKKPETKTEDWAPDGKTGGKSKSHSTGKPGVFHDAPSVTPETYQKVLRGLPPGSQLVQETFFETFFYCDGKLFGWYSWSYKLVSTVTKTGGATPPKPTFTTPIWHDKTSASKSGGHKHTTHPKGKK